MLKLSFHSKRYDVKDPTFYVLDLVCLTSLISYIIILSYFITLKRFQNYETINSYFLYRRGLDRKSNKQKNTCVEKIKNTFLTLIAPDIRLYLMLSSIKRKVRA